MLPCALWPFQHGDFRLSQRFIFSHALLQILVERLHRQGLFLERQIIISNQFFLLIFHAE